jgi:hypothetical protein
MLHLTLTGPCAGRPLCDCDKQQALRNGDTFQHVDFSADYVFESPDTCPVCRAFALTIDEPEEVAETKIAAARRALESRDTNTMTLEL